MKRDREGIIAYFAVKNALEEYRAEELKSAMRAVNRIYRGF